MSPRPPVAFEATKQLQEKRCIDLLREARDCETRAQTARAQAQSIAKSWNIELDKLAEGE